MFPTESFDQQLDDLLDRACGTLELSPTQHNTAEGGYGAIGEWLSAPGSALALFRPGRLVPAAGVVPSMIPHPLD